MDTVIPLGLLAASTHPHLGYHITSTGSLRYNVYQGFFYYDDIFSTAPFANVFSYYPALPGSQLMALLSMLNTNKSEIKRKMDARFRHRDVLSVSNYSNLPSFVSGPGRPAPTRTYDLFVNAFDIDVVCVSLGVLLRRSTADVRARLVPFHQNISDVDYVDSTLVWAKAAPKIWPCPHAKPGLL